MAEKVRKTVVFYTDEDSDLIAKTKSVDNFSNLIKRALRFYFEHKDAPPMDQIEAMIDRKLAGLTLAQAESDTGSYELKDEAETEIITDDLLDDWEQP